MTGCGDVLIAQEETQLLSAWQTVPAASVRGWDFFARPWVKRFVFLPADVVALTLAEISAGALLNANFRVPREAFDSSERWILVVPFVAMVLYLFDGYSSVDLRRPEQELELSVKAVSLSFLGVLAVNLLFLKGLAFSPYLIVVWYAFALLFLVCGRWLLRSFYSLLWKTGRARSRALVIGPPEQILRYQQLLSLQRHHFYDIVRLVPSNNGQGSAGSTVADFRVLGGSDHWEEIVRRQGIQHITLALPDSDTAHRTVLRVISRCRDLHLDVEVFSEMYNSRELNHEFDSFTGCFRLSRKPQWSRAVQRFCKWGMDLTFGIFGTLITLLITPIIGLLINLEDPGPIFYRREFVGCDGETYHYLKFRTMVRNADEILHNNRNLKARFLGNYKLREDPRTLRVGRLLRKFSIDEFPQFFSLLFGQLTLVGPRVIAREEKGRYGDFLQKRLSVKPGITGYWQVMGRQMTTYDERILMDMFYIDHWSIWLDLFIVAKTFGKMIWPEGAY